MDYIPFTNVIKELNIRKGDILLVSSEIINIMFKLIKYEGISDPHFIIDVLKETIGTEGTLLFPTFNWDFCKGVEFDYYKTPSMTGSLSKAALQREDFKRTRHPLYSFAVWGKHQDNLYSLSNTDSFGIGSPFDFLYKHNAKNLLIDVDYQNCFTFLHYVEECVGTKYRYIKHFSGVYVDDKSNKETKEYSMYVRNLEIDVENNINPIGEVFEEEGIAIKKILNNIPFIVVDLFKSFDVIKDDIMYNSAKNLVKYKGQ